MTSYGESSAPPDDLFLPDPSPAEVRYTVVSVDDHVVEPPHLFATYMQPRLRDLGPQLIETDQGHQVWEFDGERYVQMGMNAVAGRRPETVKIEPFRFEQMRPGCYDIEARVRDMDLGGIWAMLNFPEPDHRFLRLGVCRGERSRCRYRCCKGLERLAFHRMV